MKKNSVNDYEFNKFLFFISYFFTAFILFILGFFLINIPNDYDISFIEKNYFVDISNFSPERSEFITYFVLTICFPILFFFFYHFFKRKKFFYNNVNDIVRINKIMQKIFLIFLFLLFIIILIFNSDYMFIKTLFFHGYIYAVFLIFFIVFFIFTMSKLVFLKNDSKFLKIFLIVICAFIIFYLSFLHINYNFSQNLYMLHHFDAYYYPILKIQSGLTLLVDFNSLYGNYAYFFAFILNFFSPDIRIFVFSIICSILVFISYGCLAFFSYKLIKNKIIWFITFGTLIFNVSISNFYDFPSPYLQYVPHRIFFPSIILIYILFYIKKDRKRFLRIIGDIICSFSLFWNLESGLAVSGTWILFLIYECFYFGYFKEKKIVEFLKIIFNGIFLLLMYFFLLFFIIYVRTGNIFNISNLISGIMIFFGNGFYMIKMKFFHPWLFLIIIYSFGFIYSVYNIGGLKESFERKACSFILFVLGMGIFVYYQGRSHNDVFLSVIYPGVILLGIFLDLLLKKIKFKFLVFFCSIFLSFFTISIFFYYFDNRLFKFIENRNQKYSVLKNSILSYSDYVEKNNNIDFIVEFESLYYSFYNLQDKKPFPSYVDLFYYKDIEKIIDYLNKTENNIVIAGNIYNVIEEKYSSDLKEINKRFNVKKLDDGNYYFILKKNNNK